MYIVQLQPKTAQNSQSQTKMLHILVKKAFSNQVGVGYGAKLQKIKDSKCFILQIKSTLNDLKNFANPQLTHSDNDLKYWNSQSG